MLGVWKPMYYRKKVRKKHIVYGIVASWILATIITGPVAIEMWVPKWKSVIGIPNMANSIIGTIFQLLIFSI